MRRIAKRSILWILIGVLYAWPSHATEPDFYIIFESCKTIVGYLVLSKESLKVFEGDPTTMRCSRRADNISCAFEFKSGDKGHKGNTENYKIVIDSPPSLNFTTPNGSEFIAIDTTKHAAVLVSRVLHEKFTGSKVCQGLYATSFEMKNLQK